ncbi:carbohydrate deacetylase [Patescibacteria group bacterium]
MTKIIINADDFGYSRSINEGILEAIKNGVVSSTSIMVYGKAASEAVKLKNIDNISVGLHLHMEDVVLSLQEEFDKQVKMFIKLFGRAPDHVDVHKPRSSNMEQISPLLERYSEEHQIPSRELNHAKSIKGFFGINVNGGQDVDSERVSVENLLHILENLDEGVSEIMTHVGYSDDELRSMSSYNDTRELELKTLTDEKVIKYFNKTDNLKLVNWKTAFPHGVSSELGVCGDNDLSAEQSKKKVKNLEND